MTNSTHSWLDYPVKPCRPYYSHTGALPKATPLVSRLEKKTKWRPPCTVREQYWRHGYFSSSWLKTCIDSKVGIDAALHAGSDLARGFDSFHSCHSDTVHTRTLYVLHSMYAQFACRCTNETIYLPIMRINGGQKIPKRGGGSKIFVGTEPAQENDSPHLVPGGDQRMLRGFLRLLCVCHHSFRFRTVGQMSAVGGEGLIIHVEKLLAR